MTNNSAGKPSPGNETITGKTVREEGCHLLPTEHERILLEPAGAPDRCWCQDNVWGDEAVEYVRVDLITPAPAPHLDVEDIREQKLATVVAPDNGTPQEVLSAVLECARAWVPEARIIGNVRAGDIARAIEALPAEGQP